jgi:sulfonate transport system permease protein
MTYVHTREPSVERPKTGLDPLRAPALVELLSDPEAKRRRRRLPRWAERLLGVAALFAIWQIGASAGWISPQFLAGPWEAITTGYHMLLTGELGDALWASVQRVLWGLLIGIPVGVVLAVTAGLTRTGDAVVDSNVQMLRFVPIIGLQPLLILWVGIGETTKVTLIALGVMFPVYVNTYAAIRSIDPKLHELAQVLGLSRWGRIRRIVLPGALPGFMVGVTLASAVAWLLLVFAEQINATTGLGALMIQAEAYFESSVIVVCLVTYAVLGLITYSLMRVVEQRVLRWQPGR